MSEQQYCGFVGIVGRPNVGKSTLLNQILGQKISITSGKAQTTRHRIYGVNTRDNMQTVYIDTPGLHMHERKALNRYMNRTVQEVMRDVDILLFIVDARRWTEEDDLVLKQFAKLSIPVVLAVNKIDEIKPKQRLLPVLDTLSKYHDFASVVPISALQGTNVDKLEHELQKLLPECMHLFPGDQITDRSIHFLISEIIREKLMRFLGDELPYASTVVIESYKEEEKFTTIHALILVERQSQKTIVIGNKGQMLKKIGTVARKDIERLLDEKVNLQLWVKVKSSWSDDDRGLESLGYE